MTDEANSPMSCRMRLLIGSVIPSLVGFVALFAYGCIVCYRFSGVDYRTYEYKSGHWVLVLFPVMFSGLVATSHLGITGVMSAFLKPRSKTLTFLSGLATLPLAVVAALYIKRCL